MAVLPPESILPRSPLTLRGIGLYYPLGLITPVYLTLDDEALNPTAALYSMTPQQYSALLGYDETESRVLLSL